MADLSESQQQTLIDFATFLSSQNQSEDGIESLLEPEFIEKPEQETVVGAIKRLKKTYYMLDTDVLLNQVSSLMGEHLLQGREADLVIEELETLFEGSYQKYRQQ